MESLAPRTLARFSTHQCADSVEVLRDGSGRTALCTYQLDAATQEKTGSVSVLQLVPSSGDPAGALLPLKVEVLAHVDTAAVFDCKWQQPTTTTGSAAALLAVAGADGRLSVYRQEHSRLEVAEEWSPGVGGPLLSLDWTRGSGSFPADSLVVSHGDGSISLCQLDAAKLRHLRTWAAHSLCGSPIECWTVARNPWDAAVVWSGGDDSKLKAWDCRTAPAAPLFVSSRHTAGVCAIAWHPSREHVVATGSYDEFILLWDDRAVARGPTAAFPAGGGVWRLRWSPAADHADALLAACMHNGAHIVKCVAPEADAADQQLGWGLQPLAHFDEHKSLTYGADWLPATAVHDPGGAIEGGGDACRGNCARVTASALPPAVTCSFYDQLMCVWHAHGHITES